MRVLPVNRTANANLQNKINISVIFNYLRDNGPSYRAKISKDLQISAPAVSRAVENLIGKNYVIETERIQTESGKKAAYLAVNASHGYVFGVDLIKRHIRIAVADFNGTILRKFEGPAFNETMDVTSMLFAEIEKAKKAYSAEIPEGGPSELKAICIGVPATIDVSTGATTIAALIQSLKGSEVKKVLSETYHVPVFIENITKLSALGEKRFGAGRSHQDIVFFEVSTGIGAGVIIQNSLHRGFRGAAGEVGFSIIGTENIGYPLSNTGFFERFASVDSIAEKASRRIAAGERSILTEYVSDSENSLTAEAVCMAALRGDSLACSVIEETVKMYTVLLQNIILILDPEIVLIGGDICNLPEMEKLFLKPIRQYIERIVPFTPPQIIEASLGGDAGIIGAAYMATESLLLGMYPYKIEQV